MGCNCDMSAGVICLCCPIFQRVMLFVCVVMFVLHLVGTSFLPWVAMLPESKKVGWNVKCRYVESEMRFNPRERRYRGKKRYSRLLKALIRERMKQLT